MNIIKLSNVMKQIENNGNKAMSTHLFHYNVAKKNIEMLRHFKNIYGISGEQMKHLVEYEKTGFSNQDQYGYPNSTASAKRDDVTKAVSVISGIIEYQDRTYFTHYTDLLKSIFTYRKHAKRNSLLDPSFKNPSNIVDKWAVLSAKVCYEWWRDNHQRSTIHIGVQGYDMHKEIQAISRVHADKPFIIKEKNHVVVDNYYTIQPDCYDSQWTKENRIAIPPLWYNSIYRHGMASVVYKSRPCMVIRAKPRPVQRLKDKGIDVFIADVVSCKNSVIELIQNLYLVVYKTKKWKKHESGEQYAMTTSQKRIFAPNKFDVMGECLVACNENLKIAENTINGRLMGGITKALDI